MAFVDFSIANYYYYSVVNVFQTDILTESRILGLSITAHFANS